MKNYCRFTDRETTEVSFRGFRDKTIVELSNYLTFLGRKLRNMHSPVGDTFNHYFDLYQKARKELEVQYAYKQLEAM